MGAWGRWNRLFFTPPHPWIRHWAVHRFFHVACKLPNSFYHRGGRSYFSWRSGFAVSEFHAAVAREVKARFRTPVFLWLLYAAAHQCFYGSYIRLESGGPYHWACLFNVESFIWIHSVVSEFHFAKVIPLEACFCALMFLANVFTQSAMGYASCGFWIDPLYGLIAWFFNFTCEAHQIENLFGTVTFLWSPYSLMSSML